MDFNLEVEYTEEQEEFTKEVRQWLDGNVPKDLHSPRDAIKTTYEQWKQRRELGRRLGKKGWLHPTYPKEYGGGGLDMDLAFVLHKELSTRHIGLPPYHDAGGAIGARIILAVCSEEAKKRLLPPILTGEAATWELFTEPEAGTDEANQQTNALRAVREGEYFIINGQKIFVGGLWSPPEQFLLLTRSDLEAPRHENLAMFICPANLPGITIIPLDLFVSGIFSQTSGPTVDSNDAVKHQVFFDDVRLHESYLIGGDHDGWKFAVGGAFMSEQRELGNGTARWIAPNLLLEKLLERCKSDPNVVKRLRENPHLVESLVDIYIRAQIERLLHIRNVAGQAGAYGGDQAALYTKMFGAKFIATIAKILGPYTLTDDTEWGLDEDMFEVCQRAGMALSPAGTPERIKITMSRSLAIGR